MFSALANALKSADVAVRGSETCAYYSEQLLTCEECELLLLEDYCQQLSLPATDVGFVNGLQSRLTLDRRGLPDNAQVVIDEQGAPYSSAARPRT